MHELQYLDFSEKTTKESIEKQCNEIAILNSDSHSGLHKLIRWSDEILEDYESAMEYIEKHDGHWYDQLAVKYREYPNLKPSSKYKNLKKRLENEKERLKGYTDKSSVKKFKATYISCPKCNSKLKRELLYNESCPLCHTDLRKNTILEKIKNYQENISNIEDMIRLEEKEMQKKAIKSSNVRWLVKIEYHC